MDRKHIVLSGASLAIAADIYTVGMNAHKAQERLDAKYAEDSEALATRTTTAQTELMDKLFTALGLPLDAKSNWAIDVRYIEVGGFAILIPIPTAEEREADGGLASEQASAFN